MTGLLFLNATGVSREDRTAWRCAGLGMTSHVLGSPEAPLLLTAPTPVGSALIITTELC